MKPLIRCSDRHNLAEAGGDSGSTRREKKRSRRDILEKKKLVDGLTKSAYADNDHLSPFPSFQHYNRDGLSAFLQLGHGDRLCASLKQYIQNLLKTNMEGPYGDEWTNEEKVKRREMVAPEALYIFVHETLDSSSNGRSPVLNNKADLRNNISGYRGSNSIVGFVHYRFVVEEEIPVLYLYELQLEPRVQGKGLGKFLMQLIELNARKMQMGAVVLTVQKANSSAMNFYTSKLGYVVSAMSPSRVDPLLWTRESYEILCKAFDPEARDVLEVDSL